MQGYKSGANQNDKNKIKDYINQGLGVEDISRHLRINISAVQSFYDLFTGAKTGKKLKGKKAAPPPPPPPPPLEVSQTLIDE